MHRPNAQATDSQTAAGRPYLVHVFANFGFGGVPIRISNIINLLGDGFRHAIVAMDGCIDCRSRLDPARAVAFPPAPRADRNLVRNALGMIATLRELRPDLLLTYNWGTIEWGMANGLFPVCPHVHFESGFGIEEADGQLKRRALFRRLALLRTKRVVVPSFILVDIATRVWKLDPGKVLRIPNGVEDRWFTAPPDPGAIPGFVKHPDELIVGTVAPLRPEKNVARLVRAFAGLGDEFNARLLVMGDGQERAALEGLAASLGIGSQVVFAGHVEAVDKALGWLDVFAISSDTEQMPNCLLQAMAAGLPVAATDVGDVKRMVAPENAASIVPKDGGARLTDALRHLLADAGRRRRLGQCNKARARSEFAMERMTQSYRTLFETTCAAPRGAPATRRPVPETA